MPVQFQIYSPMPAPAAQGPLTRTIRWRLVASNNRAMAGSVRDFSDFTSAREDVVHVLDSLATAQARLAVAPDDRWRWSLVSEGIPTAWSLRTYTRRLECELSVANVRRLAPRAELAHVLRVFGEHRGRVLSQALTPLDVAVDGAGVFAPLLACAADLPIVAGARAKVRLPDGASARRAPIAPTSRDRRAVPR